MQGADGACQLAPPMKGPRCSRSIYNSGSRLRAMPNRPGARPGFGQNASKDSPKPCPKKRGKRRQGSWKNVSKEFPKTCPKIGAVSFVFAILCEQNDGKGCPKNHRNRRQLFGRSASKFRAWVHSIFGACAVGIRGSVHSRFRVGCIHVSVSGAFAFRGLVHSVFGAWCVQKSDLPMCPPPLAKWSEAACKGSSTQKQIQRRAAGAWLRLYRGALLMRPPTIF